MNRRASIGLLLGKTKQQTQKSTVAALTVSFAPYTGPWTWEQAVHLLRRTTFGPTKAQISQALADGMETTLFHLFQEQALPAPPIYYNFSNDPNVSNGESWVNNRPDIPLVTGLTAARNRSLQAWRFQQMRDSGTNIREKMLLFWHNHFVVANTNDPRRTYTYVNVLKNHALGNFRALVYDMTIDPSMLFYLNGTLNSANGPNENYARELLELFTIGKGEPVGPGDYTTYTEEDVVQIARCLTGWRHFNPANNNEPTESGFVANRHDTGDKQLSHRFDNQIISNAGDQEYRQVIDIILAKDEVARNICRELYRWFVHSDLNSVVEANIIEPMAQMLLADDYQISNALMALLASEHFYSEEVRGCMIAHPLDHFFKLVNTLEMPKPTNILQDYAVLKHFYNKLLDTEMVIHDHPTVAGWKAFYQGPQFDTLWINPATLPVRKKFADDFIAGYNNNGFRLEVDVLAWIANFDNPTDPNDLIIEIASILFTHPLTEEQVLALKDILIPGLPDFEWTVEYGSFLAGDTSLAEAVENKLKNLLGTMVNMPDFQLI